MKISMDCIEYSHTRDERVTEKLNVSHCHDSYEILFVVEGRGKYIVEGAHFNLRPRTLILIRPFQHHCVEIESDAVYERYVIHFDRNAVMREVLPTLDAMADESSEDSGSFYSPEAVSQNIFSAFERFKDQQRIASSERTVYARLLLSELITMLASSRKVPIAHNEEELGAKVVRYINEHIEENISLDDVAKRFFISKFYLCRSFKRYSGVSVHAYITQKRVLYAKQLIESGETASGAAYKVGFGDYSAFYRAYVKQIGRTPTSK